MYGNGAPQFGVEGGQFVATSHHGHVVRSPDVQSPANRADIVGGSTELEVTCCCTPTFHWSEYGRFRYGSANHVDCVKGVAPVTGLPLPRPNGSSAKRVGGPALMGFMLLAPSWSRLGQVPS